MVKLVRWGIAGQEKPGLIDVDGGIRDLSNEVDDIAGDVLLPLGMVTSSPAEDLLYRQWMELPGSALASQEWENSLASGSIIQITRQKQAWRCRRNRLFL